MAFEIETVNQERASDLKKWMGHQFIFQFQQDIVIDRERDIIFIDLGGQGRLPRGRGECSSHYCLLWKKKVITLDGYWTTESTSEGNRAVIELDSFSIPFSLQHNINEVKDTLVTTFSVYKTFLSHNDLKVRVQFPETYVYADEEENV